MSNEIRKLLAGYVDGELTESEQAKVEKALRENAELRAELEEFQKLKEITGRTTYADLPDEVWESYWESLYKKLERGIGWIFFSIGAIILLGFGLFLCFKGLFTDPNTPLLIKIGVSGLTLGVVILFVSFLRERLFAYKHNRYKRVKK